MITKRLDPEEVDRLLPGGHVVLLSGEAVAGIQARYLGLEVRDTLLVLSPEGTSFAFLLRRECSEATVAANVLRHGTGALWIDGCRIAPQGQPLPAPKSDPTKRSGVVGLELWGHSDPAKFKQAQLESIERTNTLGRWPSNLALIHARACKEMGTVKVRGHKGYPNGPGGNTGRTVAFAAEDQEWAKTPIGGHADPDGMETIAAWECAVECPVLALDGQTGHGSQDDIGGASRYYPQFGSEEALQVWLKRLILGPDAS